MPMYSQGYFSRQLNTFFPYIWHNSNIDMKPMFNQHKLVSLQRKQEVIWNWIIQQTNLETCKCVYLE